MKAEETLYEGVIVAVLTLLIDYSIRKMVKGTSRDVTVGVGALSAVALKKYAMEQGWIKPIA